MGSYEPPPGSKAPPKPVPMERGVLPSQRASIKVSTTELPNVLHVVGLVYAGITNKGTTLKDAAKRLGIPFEDASGVETALAAFTEYVMPTQFQQYPAAFAVCVEQLKAAAAAKGANGVMGIRIETDLGNRAEFYMQMYGTAVKIGA